MTENFKYSYKNTDKTIVALSVYNVGSQKCEPLYQWGPGVRDHYLIHYVVSGCGYYHVKDQVFTLNAGDVFLVYPNTPITYYADEINPWEYDWVGFNGSDAPVILSATTFSQEMPVAYQCSFGNILKEHLHHIYQCRGGSFHNAVAMTGQLYGTLALFVRSNTGVHESDNQKNYVRKAVEYINGHYAYPISIEDIAAYVGISRSQLFRCFQAYTAQSPKDYLTSFRIRQARLLLKNTDLPVKTIACSVGFDNSMYFSKVFHKACGISPTGFRKS